MILVDTSIFVSLFSKRPSLVPPLSAWQQFVTCPPVIQEVLQGVSQDQHYRVVKEGMLALPNLSDPVPTSVYIEAAEIYRTGQKKGITIRSSIDALIAAIAIHNRVPVWHSDRDFGQIAKFTGLKLYIPEFV